MPLITCRLCRKIFTAAGGRTCNECKQRLDDLYARVRDYLRDHDKEEFNVDTLATVLEADIRDIQALVDLGYLERDLPDLTASNESERQRLLNELQKSLSDMKAEAAKTQRKGPVTYGQELYRDKGTNRFR